MNDYLDFLEHYKDFKDISDLVDEVKKLRLYYSTQQYDAMYQHIQSLTMKYLVETQAWNSTHQIMPTTIQQSYINAETFLRLKGFSLLFKNGIKLQDQLSSEEMSFIESTIKPTM